VGYEEGGQLTEAVRRRPYSVVLFDEIEKAHPDVFNILLQILDDGRITDSQGRLVNFKNTIIIMTSNIGSQFITEFSEKEDYDHIQSTINAELGKYFRPEFLNRIDETVIFHTLKREHLIDIVSIQLSHFAKRLQAQKIGFESDEKARALLAEKGFDPVYGARPLKRVIQKELETPISRMLIAGELKEDCTVRVSEEGGKIVLNCGC
jgi:ATP-dependent Clp protease ATP-binding subunit ClpA